MEADKSWAVIVNPVAGNGFARGYSREVKTHLSQAGIEADYFYTETRGHARKLADSLAAGGYRYILAVGGDGTFNEVAAGLVNHQQVTFGAIPAGTGNDFISVTGFPERFSDDDWQVFLNRQTALLDVGCCNGNYFINGMGLGFDAQVALENFRDVQKGHKGSPRKYVWHIVKTLLWYKAQNMITIIDGHKQESKCFINTVAVGRRFAGGFFLTPHALADDGLFDVCLIHEIGLMRRFLILPRVPKGTHISDSRVTYYQTAALHLEFKRQMPYHLDGELYFASTMKINLLPRRLRIIYNPQGHHFFHSLQE